jgi:acetoin utilization deacetylase AcuC-like enzyme
MQPHERREFLRLLGCAGAAFVGSAFANDRRGHSGAIPSSVGLLSSNLYKKHIPNDRDQPDIPERCDAILNGISDLRDRLMDLSPRMARRSELYLCHRPEYVESVRRDCISATDLSEGDTRVCSDSFDTALYAAGGAMTAVDAVVKGLVRRVFCVLRPPGHHASPTLGRGECIFNNAAIAARYAQRHYGIGKVAIVDWDVHHGNGTQEIFYYDPSVYFCSIHQHPWYPGTGRADETGAGMGRGFTLNCPFPAGAGRREVIGQAFGNRLIPALYRFRPELIIISAGFDSRQGDPMGRFTLEDADFAEMTRMLMAVAAHSANGRLMSVLEGGYNLSGLASAARAHVKALLA